MALELDLQKRIVDVVREHGGYAHKMSHRFLVGVVDLSVKLPRHPAMFLEVKKDDLPKKADHVDLNLTVPQMRFLRDYHNAGMITGAVSFLLDGPRLRVAVFSYPRLAEVGKYIPVSEYFCLSRRRQESDRELLSLLNLHAAYAVRV